MLIPLKPILEKYNIKVNGVIQVGAHWAEEHEIYQELGIKNIVYAEPCSDAFEILCRKVVKGAALGYIESVKSNCPVMYDLYGNTCFNVACGEEEGEFDMYVSGNNQGQSNSLLKPLLHLQQHPEVVFNNYERVKVVPLDKLPFKKEDYNLLVLDVQGAEGLVLKGATETLKHIDCIYTECNNGQTYEGNMEIDEMDAFLYDYCFERKETMWPSKKWTWGDCVYIKHKMRNIDVNNYNGMDGLQVYEVNLPK